MAENELVITLSAVDEATGPLKSALNGIKTDANEAGKAGGQAGKTIQQEFKQASKDLHDFRKTLFIVTAAFAAIVASTKEAAKYNLEAKKTMDGFATSVSSLSSMVGVALSPAIAGATKVVNILRDAIEASIAGFIKMFALIFESFGAIASGLSNIAANIKNIFTGKEDPMGIVEAFRVSFKRAMDIANDSADQFLNKVESTRAQVESGQTLEKQQNQAAVLNKRELEAAKDKAEEEKKLKSDTFKHGRELLKEAAKENKAFAVANAAVSMIESIINTAVGVTKALSMANIPLAIAIGALGAAETALIASQSFAVGTPNVPSDMLAQVHQGETIVPTTFADAIRRGELTLGGPGGGGGGDIQINLYGVTINSKENIRELAEELGFEIDRKFNNARSTI